MSISKVKEIVTELESLGFSERYRMDDYIEPFTYINDGDIEYDWLLFYQWTDYLYKFRYHEDTFWYWDDEPSNWIKTNITDIATLLVLYK